MAAIIYVAESKQFRNSKPIIDLKIIIIGKTNNLDQMYMLAYVSWAYLSQFKYNNVKVTTQLWSYILATSNLKRYVNMPADEALSSWYKKLILAHVRSTTDEWHRFFQLLLISYKIGHLTHFIVIDLRAQSRLNNSRDGAY